MPFYGPFLSDGGALGILLMVVGLYHLTVGMATAVSIGSTTLGISFLASGWFSLGVLRLVPEQKRHWLLYPLFCVVFLVAGTALYIAGAVGFLNTSVLETTQVDKDTLTVPFLGLGSIALSCVGSVGMLFTDGWSKLIRLHREFNGESPPTGLPLIKKIAMGILLLSAGLAMVAITASVFSGAIAGKSALSFGVYNLFSVLLLVYLYRRKPMPQSPYKVPRLAFGQSILALPLWFLAQSMVLFGGPITLFSACMLFMSVMLSTWYLMILGVFMALFSLFVGLCLLKLGGIPGLMRDLGPWLDVESVGEMESVPPRD
jgi:hypothetical protein